MQYLTVVRCCNLVVVAALDVQTFSTAISISSAARICSHEYMFKQWGGGASWDGDLVEL